MLDKQDALKIKKKLKAKIEKTKKGRPHDLAVVYHNNSIIASFGIRRGSNKSLPHDHIPADLHLSPNECTRLAECPFSRDDWIKRMKSLKLIP
jgi:hypothetical protein